MESLAKKNKEWYYVRASLSQRNLSLSVSMIGTSLSRGLITLNWKIPQIQLAINSG